MRRAETKSQKKIQQFKAEWRTQKKAETMEALRQRAKEKGYTGSLEPFERATGRVLG
jgi:predicted acetyltransferase